VTISTNAQSSRDTLREGVKPTPTSLPSERFRTRGELSRKGRRDRSGVKRRGVSWGAPWRAARKGGARRTASGGPFAAKHAPAAVAKNSKRQPVATARSGWGSRVRGRRGEMAAFSAGELGVRHTRTGR
jgi:hypothetical protein